MRIGYIILVSWIGVDVLLLIFIVINYFIQEHRKRKEKRNAKKETTEL